MTWFAGVGVEATSEVRLRSVSRVGTVLGESVGGVSVSGGGVSDVG